MIKYINNDWEFTNEFNDSFAAFEGSFEKVRIPHTVKEVPYNAWDSDEYEMVSGYRRKIMIGDELKGQRIFLDFEGAAHTLTLYVNGHEVGTHFCGYTAYRPEITDFVSYGKENDIVVKLDSRESENIPPFGFVIDYMTYGGIYREVRLISENPRYISDVYVKADASGEFNAQVSLDGEASGEDLLLDIIDDAGDKVFTESIAADQKLSNIAGKIKAVNKWDINQPYLYTFVFKLMKANETVSEKSVRIGFRTIEFKDDGFYLNGDKIKLRGLNRHQSYPYVGYAMPKSMQVYDADILKNELGVNLVRTSHYPQSHYFIDRCDEIGLLVFTEIPGWQHVGDDAWKDQAVENVREMVMQYRNHPSIILWGVRINESQDDQALYTRTNKLARELDPTRATTGVRFLEKSQLLEDVYAFNDFSHEGDNKGLKEKKKVLRKEDANKPFIVSECNGHMYPTKPYDDEIHRTNHALRHAQILESAYEYDGHAGALSWCMFDYNTHRDFGSGDGICYHGVMDMFRNPKLAAAVYASQADDAPVLELTSSMNIGEYPGGIIGEVWAFTNADKIKFYKNDEYVTEFVPDRKRFGHMPHPPIIIDDFVGELLEKHEGFKPKLAGTIRECMNAVAKYGTRKIPLKYKLKLVNLVLFKHFTVSDGVRLYNKYVGNWGGKATGYRFDAYIGDKIVKSITKVPNVKEHLVAKANTTALTEGTSYDVAAVRISALDENENVMPYFMEPVHFEVTGDIELIGPKDMTLQGGCGGTYVRTKGRAGTGSLVITNSRGEEIKIDFTINV